MPAKRWRSRVPIILSSKAAPLWRARAANAGRQRRFPRAPKAARGDTGDTGDAWRDAAAPLANCCSPSVYTKNQPRAPAAILNYHFMRIAWGFNICGVARALPARERERAQFCNI